MDKEEEKEDEDEEEDKEEETNTPVVSYYLNERNLNYLLCFATILLNISILVYLCMSFFNYTYKSEK